MRYFALLLIGLVLSGCGYTSQINMTATQPGAVARFDEVKKQVTATLTPLGFGPAAVDFLPEYFQRYPGKIAKWKRTEDHGFLRTSTIVVSLAEEQRVIVVHVTSEDAGSRKDVKRVEELLRGAISDRFPGFEVRVKGSYVWSQNEDGF